MKKILAFLMAATLSLGTVAVSAQDVPMVRAAEREIVMDVQGEYVDGVFVAPIRRICYVANARCDWYQDDQKIIINTEDNMTRIFLYIGSDTMKVVTFTSVIDSYSEDFKLDAPLRIVNDRTLVPFEQLCKAMKLEYEWSEDKGVITVKTDEVITEGEKVETYLVADKEDVSAGEEVTLSLMVSNVDLYPDYGYGGYTAAIIYDPEKFEFVRSCMTNPDGSEHGAIGADNAAFSNDSMKAVYVIAESLPWESEVITAGKITFKALTDDGGAFKVSDRITTLGQDTTFVFSHKTDIYDVKLIEEASVLKINTSELIIK